METVCQVVGVADTTSDDHQQYDESDGDTAADTAATAGTGGGLFATGTLGPGPLHLLGEGEEARLVRHRTRPVLAFRRPLGGLTFRCPLGGCLAVALELVSEPAKAALVGHRVTPVPPFRRTEVTSIVVIL